MIVGIDFGTCYSSIAIIVNSTPFTDFVKDTTGLGIPSQYLRIEGRDYFGEACEAGNLLSYRTEIVSKMKKKVREDSESINEFYSCGDIKLTLKEIIEKYITFLIREAQKAVENNPAIANKEVEEITIAAPIGTSNNSTSATDYRTALVTIIKKILPDLDDSHIHIIDEPAAAAISYLCDSDSKRSSSEKSTAMVFDLGGGTLDICIVEHDPTKRKYEVKTPDGDLNLGGDNWDQSFAEYIKKQIPDIQIKTEEQKYDFQKSIIKAKMELTSSEDTMFSFYDGNLMKNTVVTRQEFEKSTKNNLDKAINLFKKVLNNYESGLSSIDKIILVGGSSNMPQIKNRIATELGTLYDDENIIHFDPSKAIAKGAAIHAMMESKSGYGGRDIEFSPISLHTYGVTDYVSKYDKVFVSNLIYKDVPFNGSEIRKVYNDNWMPYKQDQTSVKFDVYESNISPDEENESCIMDTSLGKPKSNMTFWVPVPEEYTGHAKDFKFKIEMILDKNNILKVIARDRFTGKELCVVRSE